jgi:hypothetical protein
MEHSAAIDAPLALCGVCVVDGTGRHPVGLAGKQHLIRRPGEAGDYPRSAWAHADARRSAPVSGDGAC